MSTKLLEQTAVKLFDDDDVSYARVGDDELAVTLPTNDAMVRVRILDFEMAIPALGIKMTDFVRFPEDQRESALKGCNALNRGGFGKFTVDDYGDMSYGLDFPVPEEAGPDDFRGGLILAMSSFSKMYPAIMRARWTGSTVEEELERLNENDGEEGDDESESGGGGIMTPEEIIRLMGEGDEDADDE